MAFIDDLIIIAIFCLGQILSLILYQSTWNCFVNRKERIYWALGLYLKRPVLWLMHLPILYLSIQLEWKYFDHLYSYIVTMSTVFSMATIGRWGMTRAKDNQLFDRLAILLFCIGVFWSPFFLYPLLISCCSLQYRVSKSEFSPKYSNLLGFEFVRKSLCMALVGMIASWQFKLISVDVIFALILSAQGAIYVQHAVAKSFIGSTWNSWIKENRLEFLVINSYLRGWWWGLVSKESVLIISRVIAKYRVLLCGFTWALELAWIFILIDKDFSAVIIVCTVFFHCSVWLLTGLISYHYIVSHVLILSLLFIYPFENFPKNSLIYLLCIAVVVTWALLLKRKVFSKTMNNDEVGFLTYLIDPADQVMAWWDSPYMRMYSYTVVTRNGEESSFSVRLFSPYDTFLTDIHTHKMILKQDFEIDPNLQGERKELASGVWGLVVDLEIRNKLYSILDSLQNHEASLRNKLYEGFSVHTGLSSINDAENNRYHKEMESFFKDLNKGRGSFFYKWIRNWPHFPGEDWVPDINPLSNRVYSKYDHKADIVKVNMYCLKTFATTTSIEILEDYKVTSFDIS